jgi:hypothetical protein
MPVTHIWRGYGTTLFLEFGDLHPRRLADGSSGNPAGDWGLMIEWGWRIEVSALILCDSEDDDSGWQEIFRRLMSTKVERVSLIGKPPGIALGFSNGLRLTSIMTDQECPRWALSDRRKKPEQRAYVRSGLLQIEISP